MRVVATAGHVDHGKSTLLRRLTGMEPDRWARERERGESIDLGFVWTRLDGSQGDADVAFVDVPGHERFLSNMLAGAAAVDDVILIVAADDGWAAQTAEHVEILDLLQVRCLVVAITKSDLVSEERVAEVMAHVASRLAGTSLEGATVVPVDSISGAGVPEMVQALSARLNEVEPIIAPELPRLWIDRAFTIPGAGPVVTGTMAGTFDTGQDVIHAPSGNLVRIRGIQALGQTVPRAQHGMRVAVNVRGLRVDQIHRGDALVSGPWHSTMTVDVVARCIGDRPIRPRGAWHMHVGTADTSVEVRPLLGEIAPGSTGLVRVTLGQSLPLHLGDRFILRSSGTRSTVGGGCIVDPWPRSSLQGMLARLQLAEDLEALVDSLGACARIAALLDVRGGVVTAQDACATLGIGELPDADSMAGVVRVADRLISDDVHVKWQAAALDIVAKAEPEQGALVTDVVAAVGRSGSPVEIQRQVVAAMCTSGVLVAYGDTMTTPLLRPQYVSARARRRSLVVDAMTANVLNPPEFDELAVSVGLSGSELQGLVDEGMLIREDGVVLAASALETATQILQVEMGTRTFTAGEARDVWATTRKFAIPLLNVLSAKGTTTFDGTHHRLSIASATDLPDRGAK